ALCDAISRFYVAPEGNTFSFFRPLAVGYSTEGKWKDDTPILGVTDHYNNTIKKLNDTAEVAANIRNALTAQQDQNGIVVLAGPANNLVAALALPGVKDLVARKVRYLVATEGLQKDPASAAKLLADWQSPVVLSPDELGAALPFPGESIEKDFA